MNPLDLIPTLAAPGATTHKAAHAIELVRPLAPHEPTNWTLLLASLFIAGVLIAAAAIVWRRAEPEDPADEAFRRLARAFRLRRRDRDLIRRLATAHGTAAPAALLLSEHAYRAAMESLWPATDNPTLRAHAGRLLNHLHGNT